MYEYVVDVSVAYSNGSSIEADAIRIRDQKQELLQGITEVRESKFKELFQRNERGEDIAWFLMYGGGNVQEVSERKPFLSLSLVLSSSFMLLSKKASSSLFFASSLVKHFSTLILVHLFVVFFSGCCGRRRKREAAKAETHRSLLEAPCALCPRLQPRQV